MKKLFLIISIFCLFFLVSCSGSGSNEPKTITVVYEASEGGDILGNKSQVSNDDLYTSTQVTAIADEGYKFIGWSDGLTSPKRTDTVTKSSVFTALFEKIPMVTVNYLTTEGGKIVGNPTQSLEYKGSAVTFSQVSAVADKGYKFIGWSDGRTEEYRTDTLDTSTDFTAIFEKLPVIYVKYLAGEGGIIVGEHTQSLPTDKGSVTFSRVCASALPGYRFVSWNDGEKSPFRSDTLSESATFTAIFEIDPSVTISYVADVGGYIEGNLVQTFDGPATSESVTAVADEGYKFIGWDDGVKEATRYDTCEESTTFVALFIKIHNVTITSNYPSGNSVLGGGVISIENGGIVTATANAGVGYRFVCWSNGETNQTLSITITEDSCFEAIFERESASLPIIVINTINNEEIVSKDEYLDCFVSVENTSNEYLLSLESARIKGRGNSTWEYDKKPYRLKFDSGIDLFGNGKAKDWNLISNHSDLSLMRNYLALSLASIYPQIDDTTATQFVELYLNDEYVGVYLVCEHIEIQENRVNITESDGSGDSFLIEIDGRKDGTYFEYNGKYYVIKSPDTDSELYTDDCAEQIKSYLDSCFQAMWARDWDRVCSLMDVESFAQDYIIYEIFKSPDAAWSSFYLHKDVNGKFKCGPVWDFDRSLGVVGNTTSAKPYDNLWVRGQNPWFNALFKFEEFEELVSKTLTESVSELENTMDKCYSYVFENRDSFDRNFIKWDILEEGIWPNDDELNALGTWDKHVEYTKEYLNNSLDYLILMYS